MPVPAALSRNDPRDYVLVHGGWAGGWCWRKCVPPLRDAGHRVFTPTLTGLGERAHLLSPEIDLNTHVADILGVLEYEDLHRVILVGHSYGGMVISAVADRVPERLQHLVYLDAFLPEDGQSLRDLLDPEAWAMYESQTRATGRGWRTPPPPLARYGVSDADDVAWMSARVGDQPFRTFLDPVRLEKAAAAAIPKTYISCTREQRPPFAAAAARVRDAPGWRSREIATGHDAMVTAPERVVELLLELAL